MTLGGGGGAKSEPLTEVGDANTNEYDNRQNDYGTTHLLKALALSEYRDNDAGDCERLNNDQNSSENPDDDGRREEPSSRTRVTRESRVKRSYPTGTDDLASPG